MYKRQVLFFPQMRPEKKVPKDSADKYAAIGVPEALVPVLQKAGYNLVSDMKDVNPQDVYKRQAYSMPMTSSLVLVLTYSLLIMSAKFCAFSKSAHPTVR